MECCLRFRHAYRPPILPGEGHRNHRDVVMEHFQFLDMYWSIILVLGAIYEWTSLTFDQ
jgi:hypothetical protein